MAVKIRLARHGRKKKPFYHIVIADARSPRDGRFIEKIGYYNPMTSPATIELDREKAFEWLTKGAQPSDTAKAILKFKGVMYRKHLMRGVSKGSLSEEQAMSKYNEFIEAKDAKIAARFEQSLVEKDEWHKKISGTAKASAPVAAAEEVAETVVEKAETKTLAEMAEAKAEEEAKEAVAEAPAAETKAEETPAEAPAAEPKAEEKPAEEAKAEEPIAEAPAEEAPKAEETPAEEPKADDAEA